MHSHGNRTFERQGFFLKDRSCTHDDPNQGGLVGDLSADWESKSLFSEEEFQAETAFRQSVIRKLQTRLKVSKGVPDDLRYGLVSTRTNQKTETDRVI